MGGFIYPVAVGDLEERLRRRGGDLLARLGISGDERDDEKLTALVWGVGHGGFPVMADGSTFHSGVDIGLPDVASGDPGSWWGAPVYAVSDGEVVYAEAGTRTPEGFDFGRVILRHQAPDGTDVFALYQHLGEVFASWGGFVNQGDVIGLVGWHGDFPHVHFAIASQTPLGGDRDLLPEAAQSSLPKGDGVWNVLRVKVDALDADEWPLIGGGPFYLHNPIEVVRWTRDEQYLHDIGDGHLSRCQLSLEGVPQQMQPGDANAHQIEEILRSSPLKACAKLVELAHDPGFAPIAKRYPDAEVVKALQRALKAVGFDMGRFGPDHDGIDGDFGNTCERVVKKFQGQLKTNAQALEALHHTADDVEESGAVDWLTLMALDSAALAEESARAPAPEPAPGDSSVPERPSGTPVTAAPDAWLFDADAKKASVGFGLRLYQALMRWRLDAKGNGTPYSANASLANYEVYENVCTELFKSPGDSVSEWPDLSIFPFLQSDDKFELKNGGTKPVYRVFGVSWVSSGFTNCCNSQLAALYVALGGKQILFQKGGKQQAYWIGVEDAAHHDLKLKVISGEKRATAAFESAMVCNFAGIVKPANRGGSMLAVNLIGIGDAIPATFSEEKGKAGNPYDGTYTTDQGVLRAVRIGDWANYPTHSWLVGDVCYGIWLDKNSGTDAKGKATKPDAYVNQSSLVGPDASSLVASASKSDDPGELPGGLCTWLTKNEDGLTSRIEALYALAGGGSLKVKGKSGESTRTVNKVAVCALGCFSANAIWWWNRRAVHGRIYELKAEYTKEVEDAWNALQKAPTDKDAGDKFTEATRPADRWTDTNASPDKEWRSRGITNKWSDLKGASFARFYGRVGGPPDDNALGG